MGKHFDGNFAQETPIASSSQVYNPRLWESCRSRRIVHFSWCQEKAMVSWICLCCVFLSSFLCIDNSLLPTFPIEIYELFFWYSGFPNCPKFVKHAGMCSAHGPRRKRCLVGGCDKASVQRGMCIAHGAKKKLCLTEGCERQGVVKGMCKRHRVVEEGTKSV